MLRRMGSGATAEVLKVDALSQPVNSKVIVNKEAYVRSRRVDNVKNYLTPSSPDWGRVAAEQITMMPTPLAMQPTEYIRNSWANKPYGQVSKVAVASVHDGETWALRASWEGGSLASGDFADALAIALPVRNKPVLALMGGADAPIHMLRWSAKKKEEVLSLLATGIGLSRPGPDIRRSAQAVLDGSTWHVVIARALGKGMDVAPLLAGKKSGVGFAIWRGANDERAGIKAFSIDWTELVLDA